METDSQSFTICCKQSHLRMILVQLLHRDGQTGGRGVHVSLPGDNRAMPAQILDRVIDAAHCQPDATVCRKSCQWKSSMCRQSAEHLPPPTSAVCGGCYNPPASNRHFRRRSL